MSFGTRRRYRSELVIITDMLRVIADGGREGVKISDIARKSNASHDMVIEKRKTLLRPGGVESEIKGRNRIYGITNGGIKLFGEIQKFRELVNNLLQTEL